MLMRAELRSRVRQFNRAFGNITWIDKSWADDLDNIFCDDGGENAEAWRKLDNGALSSVMAAVRRMDRYDADWLDPSEIFVRPS